VNLTFFCLLLFMYTSTVGMLFTAIPLYSEAIGADEVLIGFIVSSYALAYILASPLWGVASDRLGRKRMLVLGMLGHSASVFMFYFANNPLQMIVIRLIEGFFGASFWIVPTAFVADASPSEKMGEAMGKVGTFQSAGFIIGPVLGGIIIEQINYSSVFFTSSTLALLAALLVLLGVHDEPKISDKEVEDDPSKAMIGIKEMAKRNLIVTYTNYAFSAVFFGVVISQFVVNANNILGTESILVGFLLTGYFIVEALIQFPSGKLSDVIGRLRTILLAFCASALGFSILIFAFSFEYLLVSVVIIGVGVGTLYVTLTASLMDTAPSLKRGLISGLQNIAWGVGYFLGPFVGGIASAYSFSAPYVFCIITATVGATLTITFSKGELTQ